jgi:hypothetical protein
MAGYGTNCNAYSDPIRGWAGCWYMAVDVKSGWLDRGAGFVEIEMQQKGVGWWGRGFQYSRIFAFGRNAC